MNCNRHFDRNNLDQNFDLEKNYFFKELSSNCLDAIKHFINKFISDGITDSSTCSDFFKKYPNIKKGSENLKIIRKLLDEVASPLKKSENFFESYQVINNFICNEYMMAKPAILDCIFFPSHDNERIVINMLRTCKYSLDIAIFTLTNDKIFSAIEELWNSDVDIRIITDDENVDKLGSDINKLASIGVPVKTDNSAQYHMHHKFAIVDEAVVITGSFNWTTQAVNYNQENILFIENERIAKKYCDEFENLWKSFITIVDQDSAKKKVSEERSQRRKYNNNK